ncbi:MAG: hypothetical protein WCH78_10430 [Bacteroidota bacterium]
MKVYDFIIELKRPSYRKINTISQLMYLLSIIVFSSMLFFQKKDILPAVLYISIIGIIGWWIYCLIAEKKGNFPFYRIGLLFAAAGWFWIPNSNWIFGIYIIAAFLEKQAKFPQEIAFGKDEIVINSFPKKIYQWGELNNAIIKDGIITLDFKNNKLLQKEIQSGSTLQDELDFNEFCKNQLNAVTKF